MLREHKHDPTTGAALTSATSGSVLPKILGIVAVIGILRMLAHHRPGHGDAASWRDRRKAMIADLHRELHREDAEAPAEGTAKT